MLELMITTGQAACALLLVYGAFLVLLSGKTARPEPKLEHPMAYLQS
jgi:hypothetical protein